MPSALSGWWPTYGGGVADALGGVADLINRPANALMGVAGVPYWLPVGAVQGAIPQPQGALGQATRFGVSLATPMPVPGAQFGEAASKLRGALDALEGAAAARGVDLSLGGGSRGITLGKIVVPAQLRGQGIGSDIMRQITNFADQTGQRIMLSPSNEFGGTVSRLKDFYAGHGFVPNAGKFKDFTVSESMYRDPVTPAP